MELYEGTFIDHDGKTKNIPGHFANDADAKAFFNSIAAKSRCQWQSLSKFEEVTVPKLDVDGTTPINAQYQADAADGSSVQNKAKMTWDTTVPRKFIPVELPSPKADFVGEGSRENKTDPLDSGVMATLLTRNGTAAEKFRHAVWHERVRRS